MSDKVYRVFLNGTECRTGLTTGSWAKHKIWRSLGNVKRAFANKFSYARSYDSLDKYEVVEYDLVEVRRMPAREVWTPRGEK